MYIFITIYEFFISQPLETSLIPNKNLTEPFHRKHDLLIYKSSWAWRTDESECSFTMLRISLQMADTDGWTTGFSCKLFRICTPPSSIIMWQYLLANNNKGNFQQQKMQKFKNCLSLYRYMGTFLLAGHKSSKIDSISSFTLHKFKISVILFNYFI